jgi:hypothetical protein
MAPPGGPYFYPQYPPPPLAMRGRTDGRATASLLAGIAGLLLVPLGLPGLTLGPVAYFLGRSSVGRIQESKGALGGRSTAVAGWVIGVIATAVGAAITLVWLVLLLISIAPPSS